MSKAKQSKAEKRNKHGYQTSHSHTEGKVQSFKHHNPRYWWHSNHEQLTVKPGRLPTNIMAFFFQQAQLNFTTPYKKENSNDAINFRTYLTD